MKLSSISLIFLLVTGCAGHLGKVADQPLSLSQERLRIQQLSALKRFNQFLTADGAVLFESWNGTRRGVDCDFRINFQPYNKMVLEEDGIGPMTFRGTYEIRHDGRLKIFVPSYRNGWPVMVLKMEENILNLSREDGVTYFGTEAHPDPGFWPFVCKNGTNHHLDQN